MQARIDQMFRKRNIEEFAVSILEDMDGVKWARSCLGPIANRDAPNLKCYGCNEPLSFVKAHQSTRNGIKHDVKSFYRHLAGLRPHCSSETLAHKAAKHALEIHKEKWNFYFPCGICHNPIRIEMCNQYDTIDQEVTWKQYKLDIGIKREDHVIGAIEVLVTHTSTASKLYDLTNDDVAWCEVHAHRVLDAVKKNTFEVEVAKCAVQICDHCIEKEKKRVFQELDRELMRSAADASMLRQKRQCIIQKATSQWQQMTPTESHNDEQKKWILLTQYVQKSVITKASELGLCTEDASTHAGELLDGELILHFGKHKGRTLLSLQKEDWPYLLWLAGYNFGTMNDRGKAEKRVATNGSKFITNELETEAKNIVQGLCFNCQGDICDFDKQPWRTWCKRCYAQLRYN
jgi:hypothetical protein